MSFIRISDNRIFKQGFLDLNRRKRYCASPTDGRVANQKYIIASSGASSMVS